MNILTALLAGAYNIEDIMMANIALMVEVPSFTINSAITTS